MSKSKPSLNTIITLILQSKPESLSSGWQGKNEHCHRNYPGKARSSASSSPCRSFYTHITAPALIAHEERLAVVASLPGTSDVTPAAVSDCRKGVSQVARKNQPVARPDVAGERNDPATNGVVCLSRINDRGALLRATSLACIQSGSQK